MEEMACGCSVRITAIGASGVVRENKALFEDSASVTARASLISLLGDASAHCNSERSEVVVMVKVSVRAVDIMHFKI